MERKLKQVCSRPSGWLLTVHVCVGVHDHVYTRRQLIFSTATWTKGSLLLKQKMQSWEFPPLVILTLQARTPVAWGRHHTSFTHKCALSCLCTYLITTISSGKYAAENFPSPIPEIIGLIILESHFNTTLLQMDKTTAKSYRATETSLPQEWRGCAWAWDVSTSNLLTPFCKTSLCK